ncbi:rifin [Plasmodium reichenowi]|uniref:Rifin n=1 Tax=Plasmodium reichenowi TaxID=5854 RepID=A0A060RQP7_PLARE|nr:rifin [Plasmodium reichenowi]
MKVNYINILMFSLLLNILVNTHKKASITPHHTPKIPTTRLLCECELYVPANYDNDPQMKEVMQQFEDRTSQRLRDYDDRMIEKRKQCKERCDKEIQKIILKDKLEKQMAQQLTTLETKITTDDIPTCVCEKSLADKTEKFCLNCGMNVGGGVTLSSGVLGGIAEAALIVLKPAAITAAKEAAEKAAAVAATKAGINAVKLKIKGYSQIFELYEGFVDLRSIVTSLTYKDGPALLQRAKELIGEACINPRTGSKTIFYNSITIEGESYIGNFAQDGAAAYSETLSSQTTTLTKAKVGAVNTGFESSISSINAAIIAIVVIVLIMVIIYLILRYRRKKKMKKKLQYIKLLEE